MSADRTLMSVMRTSLSLISFGFTIFQVFANLHDAGVTQASVAAGRFGQLLVTLGIAMLVFGILYHLMFMKELRASREEMRRSDLIHAQSRFPPSMTLVTAVLLLIVGTMAIVSMVSGAGPLG